MAVQQNFRSALNGFNREDVVRYIEYLNAKHVAEVNRLNSELDFLRGKQAPAVAAPVAEVDPALEQQAARIRELFDENNALKAEKTGLEEQLTAAMATCQELQSQLDAARAEHDRTAASLESALEQKNSAAARAGEELEAYRRAERAERMARERAEYTERMARERTEQMYRQASGVIADATARVDETAGQIGEMTDRVLKQLLELQNAVVGSKQILQDAMATMYAIRPETEE